MTSISSAISTSPLQQSRVSLFQKADLDQSGGISLYEFKALAPGNKTVQTTSSTNPFAEEIFSSFDTDSDGNLTQQELENGLASAPPPPGQGLISLDTLGDLISQLGEGNGQDFLSSLDSDRDGTITSEELQAGLEDLASSLLTGSPTGEDTGAKHAGGGGPPPGGGGSNEEEGDTSTTTAYDPLDTNQDGVVSLDEILATEQDDQTQTGSKNEIASRMANFLLSLQEQMNAA